MAKTLPRHRPVVFGNVHPIKIEKFDMFSWRHFSARSSFYIINWYGYPRGSHEKHLKKNDTLWHLCSLWYSGFLQSDIGMNAVSNALYRFFLTILWAILTAVYEFYMLNVKYWRIFCDVISLLAQVFIVSFDRAYKEVSAQKILKMFYGSVCDMTVPSKSNVPSLWHWPMKVNVFQWIDNDPICVLYEFHIDISTNS